MYKLSQRSKDNLEGIEDILIKVLLKSIPHSPYDFGVPSTGGLRTAAEQHQLYLDGKSGCDGYKKKSYHQTGKAFDIYAYVNGKASWESHHLKAIAKHILNVAKEDFGIELTWGGTFLTRLQKKLPKEQQEKIRENGDGWDQPHFQM